MNGVLSQSESINAFTDISICCIGTQTILMLFKPLDFTCQINLILDQFACKLTCSLI